MSQNDPKPHVETTPASNDHQTDAAPGADDGRRKALGKLAYASPVLAGLLFSRRSAAQISGFPPIPGTPR